MGKDVNVSVPVKKAGTSSPLNAKKEITLEDFKQFNSSKQEKIINQLKENGNIKTAKTLELVIDRGKIK